MTPYARTIAIDGPAGCGKSALGHRLANRLGYFFLDSGILYRAITRHVMNCGISPYDREALAAYAETLTINILELRPAFKFRINGERVRRLHAHEINLMVPKVAACPAIRERVREMQREIAAQGDVILAGRDIGTVVLPDAELKIYLDVSIDERVKRRFTNQNSEERTFDDIKQELLARDTADATREVSPMRAADDAVILTTDGMALDEVVEIALSHARVGSPG